MAWAGLDDPAGMATPASIANSGECFRLTVDDEVGVFVLQRKADRLWVAGAGAVGTAGMTAPGLSVIEAIAAQSGCKVVAFQTGRAGLAKLAKKQGYRLTGFIMEKSV